MIVHFIYYSFSHRMKESGPKSIGLAVLALIIHCTIVTRCQHASICHTYRALTMRQQNEHQCLILEKLHQDLDKEKKMLRTQYQDLYS